MFGIKAFESAIEIFIRIAYSFGFVNLFVNFLRHVQLVYPKPDRTGEWGMGNGEWGIFRLAHHPFERKKIAHRVF